MRKKLLILLIILAACNNNEPKTDSLKVDLVKVTPENNPLPTDTNTKPTSPVSKTYSNKRFRDITVDSFGKNKFLIRGEGQIFEAAFSWVVEDGHEELKKGFHMTDAGAPAW
ncbi:MAG: hypothetical protein ABIO04_04630, partial [Ferruginibacter sp.]